MNVDNNHRIVLLGPPASGKGTQGKRLSARWEAPITSTGELLRREHNLGTEIGLEADRLTSLGQLVSDDVVIQSVAAWLDATPSTTSGLILDGTPRTLGQAVSLEELLGQRGLSLTAAILLEVTPETVADRVQHRVVCDRCGSAFCLGVDVQSITAACPACGGTLERRRDDDPDVLPLRMAEYEEKTTPLLPYYEAHGLLRRVIGEGTVDEVFSRVLTSLEVRRDPPSV